MKYYLFRLSSDPKVIGVKEGSQVWLDESDPQTKKVLDFRRENLNIFRVPDFDIHISAKLEKNAKLTDFLDFGPYIRFAEFMISERLAEIFGKLNIQEYKLFPVTLYNKSEKLEDKYYLFSCKPLEYDVINFKDSVFYKGSEILKGEYYRFQTEEEFIAGDKKAFGSMMPEKLVMNSKFDSTLDFIRLKIGTTHISEALKDAIEILGITGANIQEGKDPQIIVPDTF